MAIKSKFKPATPVYLNGALAFENEVRGFPSKVLTWGQPLSWRTETCAVSREAVAEKRDHFNKRSELCFTIADAGSFDVAVAYAPNVSGGTTKRPLKCLLCGSTHNWCVFYRRTSDQSFLGYSGCDCFGEVCRNIQLPNAEAVAKYVTEEKARCERFRRTMEKINDFKSIFPGLYEEREWLHSSANPYHRLWQEVENQLNRGEGVTPDWLQGCREGKQDRTYRWRSDQSARRVPEFLDDLTKAIAADGVQAAKDGLVAKALAEPLGSPYRFHAQRTYPARTQAPAAPAAAPAPVAPQAPAVAVAPAPAAGKPTPADDAAYLDSKGYGWSSLVKLALAGRKVTPGMAKWLAEKRREEEAKSKPKPVVDDNQDLPDEPTSRPAGVQIGDL